MTEHLEFENWMKDLYLVLYLDKYALKINDWSNTDLIQWLILDSGFKIYYILY